MSHSNESFPVSGELDSYSNYSACLLKELSAQNPRVQALDDIEAGTKIVVGPRVVQLGDTLSGIVNAHNKESETKMTIAELMDAQSPTVVGETSDGSETQG
jgi:hypothetical protein